MEHAKLLKCRNFLAAIYLISLLISGSNPALAINAARDYQLEFSLPRQEQASVFLWLNSIATAHDGSIWTSDNSSGYATL